MEIKTYKVKEYNSTKKTVVIINGEPVCIVKGKKTLSTILAYAQGYDNTGTWLQIIIDAESEVKG